MGDSAPIPSSKSRHLRACLLCSIVMSAQDFKREGCPNCEELVQMYQNPDRISRNTSAQFDGIIALTNPGESWVGRWQRVGGYVKGLYAVRVTGRISQELQAELDARGITYRPRDTMPDT